MRTTFEFALSNSEADRSTLATWEGDTAEIRVTGASAATSGELTLHRITTPGAEPAFTVAGTVADGIATFAIPTSEANDFITRITLTNDDENRLTVHSGTLLVR